ncbi:MAG TPA: OmpA family protein, partial [Rhodopila sp.]|nr:OmpA family protein [Rhodopila sp.]
SDRIRRDAPGWHLTVLGHTDATGSDAYNMDLSRRRAAKVLRALVDRGLDPSQLSAVAIGKRQPIADNRTEAGRARNRRVEFLMSRCLEANLGVVRQNGGTGSAQVLRLDQDYQLASIGSVALHPLTPAAAATPAPLRAGPSAARPLPPAGYQPNMLAPEAQPSPLRAPVPY